MANKKSGLGKGLEALFVENSANDNMITMLNISEIEPNTNQPRKIFNELPLTELADSIKEHGVLQPLIVKQLENGRYQIVAGERRWRASRMAGLKELPVIVKELSDSASMQLALIENLQRENLNIIEEALGYRVLAEEYDLTQEEIAKKVGKSRPAVTNALRLLKLPDTVIDYVKSGELSSGHARALLTFEDDDQIIQTAEETIKKGLSVREIERRGTKKPTKDKLKETEIFGSEDSFFTEMELALRGELMRGVKIRHKNDAGVLEIEFLNREELKDLADMIIKALG